MTDDLLTAAERDALAEIEAFELTRVSSLGDVLSFREIAKRLGTSHGNVHNIYDRAIGKLTRYAQDWAP